MTKTAAERFFETGELSPRMRETAMLTYDLLRCVSEADRHPGIRPVRRVFHNPPTRPDGEPPYQIPQITNCLEFLAASGAFEQAPHEVLDGENVTLTLSDSGERMMETFRGILEHAGVAVPAAR